MRWLSIVVVLFALAAAGCGGSNESSGDTDTVVTDTTGTETTETTTEETTTDETTDETTVGAGDLGFTSGDCRDLANASVAFADSLGAGGGSEDLDQTSELFDRFAADAPEEIRTDIETLAKAYAAYAKAFGGIDLQAGEVPSGEQAAELQQALSSIDQPGTAAAAERVGNWVTENCAG